jgi:serine/threonine protein kinase
MTVTKKRSIAELFFRADKQLIDLLEKIFQINPKKRIKIEEIVKHPFVNRFKGRGEDKKTNEPIKIMYES